MIWGEESQGSTERFAAKALDPSRLLDPESTGVLGVGAAEPTVEPLAESGGSQSVGAASGQGAWRRRLAPHHREAVKSFFAPAGAK